MDDENVRVSLSLIASTTAVSVLLLIVLVGRVIVIRKKKIRTGEEALIGMIGEASEDFEGEGRMWLLGESWIAKSTEAIGGYHDQKIILQGVYLPDLSFVNSLLTGKIKIGGRNGTTHSNFCFRYPYRQR